MGWWLTFGSMTLWGQVSRERPGGRVAKEEGGVYPEPLLGRCGPLCGCVWHPSSMSPPCLAPWSLIYIWNTPLALFFGQYDSSNVVETLPAGGWLWLRPQSCQAPTEIMPQRPPAFSWRSTGCQGWLPLRTVGSNVQRLHTHTPRAMSGILVIQVPEKCSCVGPNKVFGLFQVSELRLHLQDSAQRRW